MLSSKVTIINNIINTLNTSRRNALAPLKAQPLVELAVLRVLVYSSAINKMFLTKFNPPKQNQDL